MDEVVSLRVAPGGVQGLYGIRPDLTTMGKIVGGGLPVGAFGGRASLMDLLDGSGPPTGYAQSGTFSGHALAMAAGWATLRQLTPAAHAHLDALGARICRELAALLARRRVPARVVGLGSLFSVYFTGQPVTGYRAAAGADGAKARRVALRALEQGVMLTPELTMNTASLPMGPADVDALLAAFEAALDQEAQD